MWALIVAAFLAFVFSEAAARLTVVSGFNLGQAIQWKARGSPGAFGSSYVSLAVAVFYTVVSVLGEVNNFLGVMLAIEPAYAEHAELRAPISIFLGVVILALMMWDSVDTLCQILGESFCYDVALENAFICGDRGGNHV